ncbi:tolloid-like protein 1 [Daphnia carinata]|uniref:tolloid-like protein 1 n=1 Tax=Daphnia carinata TaxID=120202 RepID=UPI0028693462|nr:tolloid-like protein 1 [Daphnia carinata]
MILYTIFQFTMIFELLFFVLWAFPSWVNKPLKVASETKQSDPSFIKHSGSCDIQGQCGLCDLTKDGGTITFSNFPNEIDSDMNCQITIKAPSHAKIELTFAEFKVEQCCDRVTVSDGESELFEFRLTRHIIPYPITSSSGRMNVKFTTDVNYTTVIPSPELESARWQATFKFLRNETVVTDSQLDKINNQTETLEPATTLPTI